tara:strand:- start:42955 stop:43752 length:798 start_codon:yes stop_codon:yes gene_type:complete
MVQLTELAQSPVKHICVYGAPKSGKTELAGKLSEKFNLVWFDLEKGSATLHKLPAEWKQRINVIQIPDTRVNPQAIDTMLKVMKGLPVEICIKHGKVSCPICRKEGAASERVSLNDLGPNDCVVIDSGTQLTNSAIAHITRDKDELYKLQHDDWGNLGKLMDTILSYIQAAPYNVVWITHENEVKVPDGSKEGKDKLVPTAGTRNFSRNSAKYFDEVVYCEIKNKQHRFASSTTYANGILTGGRSSANLDNNPNAKLLDLWETPQ